MKFKSNLMKAHLNFIKKSAKITTFSQIFDHFSPLRPWFLLRMNVCLSSILWRPTRAVIRSQKTVKGRLSIEICAKMRQNSPKLRINGSKTKERSGSISESMRCHSMLFWTHIYLRLSPEGIFKIGQKFRIL